MSRSLSLSMAAVSAALLATPVVARSGDSAAARPLAIMTDSLPKSAKAKKDAYQPASPDTIYVSGGGVGSGPDLGRVTPPRIEKPE